MSHAIVSDIPHSRKDSLAMVVGFSIADDLFWSNVLSIENGCWEWQGTRDPKRYGRLKRRKLQGRRNIRAHRYAYYLFTGKWPDHCVCHRCDNPPCCNPFHLFDGTTKDNSDDKVAKGRAKTGNQTGSGNGNSVLTEADIPLIRQLLNDGHTNTAIAKRFNVHHATISLIRLGKHWAHV